MGYCCWYITDIVLPGGSSSKHGCDARNNTQNWCAFRPCWASNFLRLLGWHCSKRASFPSTNLLVIIMFMILIKVLTATSNFPIPLNYWYITNVLSSPSHNLFLCILEKLCIFHLLRTTHSLHEYLPWKLWCWQERPSAFWKSVPPLIPSRPRVPVTKRYQKAPFCPPNIYQISWLSG